MAHPEHCEVCAEMTMSITRLYNLHHTCANISAAVALGVLSSQSHTPHLGVPIQTGGTRRLQTGRHPSHSRIRHDARQRRIDRRVRRTDVTTNVSAGQQVRRWMHRLGLRRRRRTLSSPATRWHKRDTFGQRCRQLARIISSRIVAAPSAAAPVPVR